MSTSRFNNIHLGLSQQEAIRILSLPLEQLESKSDYYMAASHLINFPGESSENALLKLLESKVSEQEILLAQRKAIEVLARLGSYISIPIIGTYLDSSDPYLVENAAWALGQLQCKDKTLNNKIVELLNKPYSNRRVLIQAIALLNLKNAAPEIELLQNDENPGVKGAAISAVSQLNETDERVMELADHLLLPNQMDRQSAIQDAVDCKALILLPDILRSPVSPVFRMRAFRALWPKDTCKVEGLDLVDCLDMLLKDDISALRLVHEYDAPPTDEFLIQELFGTDFSRCYLALNTLSVRSAQDFLPLLLSRWNDDAHNDYGAHYFFMRLFGMYQNWPESSLPEIKAILLDAISNERPQFMKSKAAATWSLGFVCPSICGDLLLKILSPDCEAFWEVRYAALMLVEKLYLRINPERFRFTELTKNDPEPFVRFKATQIMNDKI